MTKRATVPSLVISLFCYLAISLLPLRAVPVEATAEKRVSVVRVNVTTQAWDFIHPWTKHAPSARRALGAVLQNNRVLVSAELVANANYVELEKAESGEKIAAMVDAVDYEANLALLKPNEDTFLNGIPPLALGDAAVGDRVVVWQLETTGALLITDALVTTAEVGRYPIDDTSLLTYRLTSSLQYREGSFTLPIIKGDRLIGLLMRFDPRTQNVDAIPGPVLQHFVKDATSGKHYGGFPRAGVFFSALRDPQLRRYAGLKNGFSGGVYVSDVQKNGPGDKAGIREGDVLLAIGDKAIDQDGNYNDPRYGKVSVVNLIALGNDGENVPFKIIREGKTQDISVTLTHRSPEDYVIEPYTVDKAPRFFVLGGLVLQELSRQYLKEWGGDWQKKAPERFVYYDRFQSEMFEGEHRHFVILSQVLPSASTVGYEQLNGLIITKINGVELKSLADVPAALKKPVDGFHKIEFEESPRVIYLDAKQIEADNDALMKTYGLPSTSRLD